MRDLLLQTAGPSLALGMTINLPILRFAQNDSLVILFSLLQLILSGIHRPQTRRLLAGGSGPRHCRFAICARARSCGGQIGPPPRSAAHSLAGPPPRNPPPQSLARR